MTETISIENFGPIHNMKMEIKKMHIMVGPHSSGKTLVALLIKYFRTIFELTFDEILTGYLKSNKSDIEDFLALKFKEIVRLDYSSFPNGAIINYSISNGISANFKLTFGTKKISYKENFGDFIDVLSNLKNRASQFKNAFKATGDIENIDKIFFSFALDEVRSDFYKKNKIKNKKVIYIPAARTLSFLMRDHLKGKTADIPDYLIHYYHMFRDAKERLSSLDNLSDIENKFKNKLEDFLGGKLKTKEISGELETVFVNSSTKEIQLKYLSSGQQESLPIYALLFNSLKNMKDNNYLFIIEEPEANLHPKGQADIVRFISEFSNAHKDNDFIITTHSPYIIDNFNNYILINEIYGDKNNLEESHEKDLKDCLIKLYNINEEKYKINLKDLRLKLEDFSQYGLKDGESKNIVNIKNKELGKGNIKDANDKIISLLNKILDIDFSINE